MTMSDLIRRADAVEAVCEECEWERKCHEECTHIETLKALPSAEAVQGWIPCSERLPDEEGEYIATVSADGGHMYIGIIYYGKPLMPNRKVNGKCWYHSDDEWGDVVYDDDDIFAWIQLPEPYKGGDKDGRN